MNKNLVASLAMGLFLIGASGGAFAAPVEYLGNYYEFISVTDPYTGGNNSWFTASAAASSSQYNGMTGHLATITSKEENDFLLSIATGQFTQNFAGAWIGGKAPDGWLVGPETGQSFSYTNWHIAAISEPNNSGYAYMSIGSGFDPGAWYDDSLAQNGVLTSWGQGYPDLRNDPVVGYFVEYEGAPIPEPATVLLFGTGLIGLAGLSLRRKKK